MNLAIVHEVAHANGRPSAAVFKDERTRLTADLAALDAATARFNDTQPAEDAARAQIVRLDAEAAAAACDWGQSGCAPQKMDNRLRKFLERKDLPPAKLKHRVP